MRYKPATKNPAYLGGVEEYDIYLTSQGNVVARWGNGAAASSHPIAKARYATRWVGLTHMTREKAERIAAMVRCFGPE